VKYIDPKLESQLHGLAATDRDIGAVITVQDLSPRAKALSATAMLALVDKILHNVQTATGASPAELEVQENLGTFLVRAKADFIRRLLEEDDVHYAASVEPEQEQDAFIPPRRRRRVG
jgi:hypothetical protein